MNIYIVFCLVANISLEYANLLAKEILNKKWPTFPELPDNVSHILLKHLLGFLAYAKSSAGIIKL